MNPRACPGVAVGAPVDLSPLSPRSGLPPRARLPPSFHSRRGLESLVDLPSSSSVSRNDAAESSRWVSPPPLLAGGPLPSGLPPSPVGVISPACSRVFRTPLTGGVGVFPAFPRRCASLPCAGVARCGPRPPVSSRRIPCRCVCVPRPGGPLACVASGACLSRGGRARGVLGFRRVGLPGSAPPPSPARPPVPHLPPSGGASRRSRGWLSPVASRSATTPPRLTFPAPCPVLGGVPALPMPRGGGERE